MKKHIFIYLVFGLFVTSCVKNNFELVEYIEKAKTTPKPTITRCSIQDSIFVSIDSIKSYKSRIERSSFLRYTDEEVTRYQFYDDRNSDQEVLIHYKKNKPFPAASKVIQLNDTISDFYITFKKVSNQFSRVVKSGKLYIDIDNNRNITYTWCDCQFESFQGPAFTNGNH